jgi:hypothetical protein
MSEIDDIVIKGLEEVLEEVYRKGIKTPARSTKIIPKRLNRDEIILIANNAGMKASIGRTDKENNTYYPYINALGRDVPIEWLERFADLISQAIEEKK